MVQVTTMDEARRALEVGANIVVAQGGEAGRETVVDALHCVCARGWIDLAGSNAGPGRGGAPTAADWRRAPLMLVAAARDDRPDSRQL